MQVSSAALSSWPHATRPPIGICLGITGAWLKAQEIVAMKAHAPYCMSVIFCWMPGKSGWALVCGNAVSAFKLQYAFVADRSKEKFWCASMTEYECEDKASPDRESAAAFLASSRYRMYSESTACAAALPVPACCNHTIRPISSAHGSIHVGLQSHYQAHQQRSRLHGISLGACMMEATAGLKP